VSKSTVVNSATRVGVDVDGFGTTLKVLEEEPEPKLLKAEREH
jgi:hypothetical protein